MTRQAVTGRLVVRADDGEEREVLLVSTYREDRDMYGARETELPLKDVASEDGIDVFAVNQEEFIFMDDTSKKFKKVDS